MKRKIIALVFILVMVPSMLLAASGEYTATESVTYNPYKVTLDGKELAGVIKIGDKTYINATSLAISMDKKISISPNGDISLSKEKRTSGFMMNNWGDDLNSIISKKGKFDSHVDDSYGYFNDFMYGEKCASWFFINNNHLYKGRLNYMSTYENCVNDYEYIIDKLYNEFDNIVFKDAYLPTNCPTNINVEDAIKNYNAYLYAKFTSISDTAYVTLKYDARNDVYFIDVDYEPK